MGKPMSEMAVIPSKIGIGGTWFYQSALFIVSWKKVYTYEVLTNSTNRQNVERWGCLYTMSWNSYARVSPILFSQVMRVGPVFKISPRFPFAVSNEKLQSMIGPMNRRLLLHMDVFSALSTTKVVLSESNNNRVWLPDSVVVKTVRLPVLVLPVLWSFFIIFNAHLLTKEAYIMMHKSSTVSIVQ